jgi:Uma2 family endonuclease
VLYVTPSPRYLHQRAVLELHVIVGAYVKAIALESMCLSADIAFSEYTLVQPDLFVFPRIVGKPIREWADVHPLVLAVEVLSPRTARRERTVKRRLYQTQNTPEYWIVDADARAIERWRPDSTQAEVLTTTLSWQPVATQIPLSIDLVSYFRAVHGD